MHGYRKLKIACLTIAAGAAIGDGPLVHAQAFPAKTVRFISGFAAGGGNDIMARLLAQKLAEPWGQQVVVDNRPGANTIVAMQILAAAPPDGHTIFMASTTLAINASLYSKLPYDTVADFTPIGIAARAPLVLVVNDSLPARTLRELIALAKARPGQLSFGSSGAGNSTHLVPEMFKTAAGIDMVHIAYKGTGIALIDVMSGQIPLAFSGILPALPHIRSGKLRGLAVTTSQRSPAAPEMPTIAESGLPGFEATEWFGIIGPARMPKDVVTRINSDLARIVKLPDLQERLVRDGATPAGDMTPEQFAAHVKAEIAKWGKAVRDSGARADL
jgi:tripartite-type tricarboxylate transporter receptor subunit TctC